MAPLFKPKHTHSEEVIPPLIPKAISDDDRPFIMHIKNLEKTYDIGTPLETKALRGVNFDISLAEIVIIFGPSGSGKSTLLNILAGLDEPTNGEAIIDNKDLRRMNARERAEYHQFKVGMVFQSYNLVQALTVIQNITMPARLAGFKKKDYIARGDDLLRQFDLVKLRDKLPSQCSGGQQQRVGIMRAFMNRPALIIADEPTGNLDSASSKQIMELFKALNAETNTTMIVVTHDPGLFAIADRVIHVLDGQVVKQTILTPKAKIDPKTAGVPVEFKYRTDDIDEYIKKLRGGEEEGIAGKRAESKEEKLKKQGDDLAKREEKLRQFWQQLRSLEEKIDQRSEDLAQQRAYIAQESEKITHERQHILASEITIRREREDVREQSAVLQHVVKEELEQIEVTAAVHRRKLEAAKRSLQQKEEALTQEKQKLEQQQTKLVRQQNSLRSEQKQQAAAIAQEQKKVADHKKLLEQEQYQLEVWRKQLGEWANTFEASVQKKLQKAREVIQQERQRSEKAEVQMKSMQQKFTYQQQELAAARESLAGERRGLQEERVRLREQQEVFQQEAGVTKEEKRLVQEMKVALKERKAWLDKEEARLRQREQVLEASEKTMQEKQTEQEKIWRQQEEQLRKRIAAARKMLEQAEYQMLTSARGSDSESLQELEWQYKQKLITLEKERQALLEERAALQLALNNDSTQHRLTTAASIIDHEKEQMETENERQLEDIKARQKLMEDKLAAARTIVEKEAAVIEQEYKVIEQEKQLRQVEKQHIEAERKRIEEEWERLKKAKG